MQLPQLVCVVESSADLTPSVMAELADAAAANDDMKFFVTSREQGKVGRMMSSCIVKIATPASLLPSAFATAAKGSSCNYAHRARSVTPPSNPPTTSSGLLLSSILLTFHPFHPQYVQTLLEEVGIPLAAPTPLFYVQYRPNGTAHLRAGVKSLDMLPEFIREYKEGALQEADAQAQTEGRVAEAELAMQGGATHEEL